MNFPGPVSKTFIYKKIYTRDGYDDYVMQSLQQSIHPTGTQHLISIRYQNNQAKYDNPYYYQKKHYSDWQIQGNRSMTYLENL